VAHPRASRGPGASALADFLTRLEQVGAELPRFVTAELGALITCGDFERGFMLAACRLRGEQLRVPFAVSPRRVRDLGGGTSRALELPFGATRIIGGRRSPADIVLDDASVTARGSAADVWKASRCRCRTSADRRPPSPQAHVRSSSAVDVPRSTCTHPREVMRAGIRMRHSDYDDRRVDLAPWRFMIDADELLRAAIPEALEVAP